MALKIWEDIWSRVSLCNMLEKKRGNAELFGCTDMFSLSSRLKVLRIDTPIVGNKYMQYRPTIGSNFNDATMAKNMIKIYPFISQLLEIGEGKMSLCGGSVLQMMQIATDRLIESTIDYDIFFHCDMNEADDIL